MNKKILFFIVFLLSSINFYAQIKVGENPNTINSNSLLELESSDKVLVVTRITNNQMNALTPLNGALVYNIDENCLFQFKDNTWTSLCVDVMANETVTSLIDNNDGTISYTNENGTVTIINKTALTDNSDGTYTFDNGNGSPVTIDVSALETLTTIVSNGNGSFTYTDESGATTTIDVGSLETLTAITLNADNIHIDYTDEDGNLTQLNLTDLVKNLETVTTLVDNADGTFTFTDEEGNATVLDVNNLETLTAITLNADNTNIDYTDEDGVVTQLDLSDIVDNLETVTTLVDNANGTFTFTDENGNATTLDVANLETLTSIALNADNTNIDYTDEDGVVTQLDLSDIVDNLETVTTLVDNANGTFTFTDEDGNATTLDVANLETLTSIALNADNTNIDYTDEDGVVTQLDLSDIVDNLETVTTLVDNANGTFTFTDENGNATTLDVANLETLTSIALNVDNTNIDYTDEDGVVTQLDLSNIIENLETLTSVVDNNDGTFTYTNEDGIDVTINMYDPDSDPTNELQDIALNGTELTLSNPATTGNLVDLTGQITLPMLADGNNTNDEIIWDGTQWVYQTAVLTVNLTAPDADGNVNIPIGNVYTGSTTNVGDISTNEIGGTPNEGDIYVVNSDAADPTQIGNTYIYDADTMTWVEIDPFNAALYDPRYVNVTGDTMAGNLDMNGYSITGLPNPTNPSDATPKSYVDAIELVDNNNGTFSLNKSDGTIDTVSKADLIDNNDGTYTFTNNDGSDVTIDVSTLETLTTIALNADNTNIDYTDEDGTVTQLDLSNIVDNVETVTTIVDNADGTFTYTDEDGNATTLDVANLETLTTIALNADNINIDYTDEDGVVTQLDLSDIVDNLETLTTIVDNSDGTFTFTDEDGNTTDINVSNLETLTSIALNPDNVNIDYTDEDGVVTQLDLSNIVDNLETVTTIVDNADGTFTYTDEDGNATTLDVANLETLTSIALNADNINIDYTDEDGVVTQLDLSDIVDNLETLTTIVDNSDGTFTFTDEDGNTTDINVSNLETLTSIALNADDINIDYTDEDGVLTQLDLSDIVDNLETVTTIVDNADGTFTYTDENGVTTDIDVANLETLTTIALNADDINIDYTDEDGVLTQLDLSDIVDNLETVTTIVDNADGTFTYTDENGVTTDINVANLETLTTIALNADDINIDYTDEDGVLTQLDLSDIVDNLETVTTIVDNADGTFTYTDENGVTTDIDVANLETLTTIALNADDINIDYTDEDGVLTQLDLSDIVDNLETVTTIVDNADGTFTYTDENGVTTDIDVANLETLTTIALNADDINIDYTDEDGVLTQLDLSDIVDNLETVTTIVDNADGTFTYTDENGVTTDIDVANLETLTTIALNADDINIDYTDEDGVLTQLDLSDIVDNLETVTSLTINTTSNQLEYIDEDGNTNAIDLSSLVSDGSETVVTGGGINTVTGSGTTADPYIITGTEVDGSVTNEVNTAFAVVGTNLTITDSDGTLTVPLASLGTDDQNIDVLTLDASNILTVGIEDGTDLTVDLSSLVSDGSETVVTGGGINTVTGSGTTADPYIITGTEVDGSVTNEVNTAFAVVGTNLTITDSDGTLTVPLASLGTDDQNIDVLTLDASNILTVGIEDGTDLTVDLSSLVSDGSETVVTGGGINTVTGSGTTADPYIITGTEVDGSVTNEVNTAFAVVGTNLTITDSDGTLTVPLASLGTDDQNIDVLTLDASNILTVGIEDGTDLTVDLSSLVSDGSETVVTGGGINTVTGSGTTADPYIITGTEVDGSVTNEVNTAFAVVGTNLTITDSDGTLTVPLASLGTDDQNIDVLTLDASNILTVGIEDGTDLTVDLSSLVSDGSETVVTGGGINTVTGSGTTADPYIITGTEVDGSVTNEVNTAFAVVGTNLTITDSDGTLTVPLASLGTDDQNIDVLTLDASNILTVGIEDGTDLTVDLSSLVSDGSETVVTGGGINTVTGSGTTADPYIITGTEVDGSVTNEVNTAFAVVGTNLTITDSDGTLTVPLASLGTDDQNIDVLTLDASNILTVGIEDGTDLTVDLSSLVSDGSETVVTGGGINTVTGSGTTADPYIITGTEVDGSVTNEVNTAFAVVGTNLTITDSDGTLTVPLASLGTDDQNIDVLTLDASNILTVGIEDGTDLTVDLSSLVSDGSETVVTGGGINTVTGSGTTADPYIITGTEVDGSVTNEVNTAFAVVGTNLTITDSDGTLTVPLASLGTDDQNIDVLTLDASNILTVGIEDGTDLTVDLSSLVSDGSETVVTGGGINTVTGSGTTADPYIITGTEVDGSVTNEVNTAFAVVGTNLTITDSDGTLTVPLASLGTDDQNIDVLTLDASNILTVGIEDGTDLTVDLSSLVSDGSETVVTGGGINTVTGSGTTADPYIITGTEVDGSVTNEVNTAFAVVGTNLTITDSDGTLTVPLASLGTDDQNIDVLTLDASNILTVGIEDGTDLTVDLSSLVSDGSETVVTGGGINTVTGSGTTADPYIITGTEVDGSVTNEVNTAFAVVGTNLTITDSDGTLTVPLASLGTDDQNIDVLTLDASNILTVGIEDGTDLTVDLSSLVSDGSETVVTGGGINTVTGSGTTADPYIITGTEVDGSVTNEVNTAFAVVGTNLTITDSDGTLTVPLASLGTDDQNIDVLTLDASNILTVGIEDGTDLTVDLSSLVSDGSETVVTGGGINTVTGSGTTADPYIITGTEVDGSVTNEVNTAFAVVGTNLTITDSDGTLTVPLASLGTDDQNIDVLTLDASNILTVGIEDGTDLTVDLSSLVSDGSETVVTGGGINTVTGSGTTADPYIITGTEVDGSVTNEVNTAFAVVGTNLTITDSDGTLTVPLASLGTDDQNIDVLTLDASNILTVGIEDGTDLTVDLSSLVSDGSETVVTGGGINTVTGSGTTADPYIITGTEVDGSVTNEVNTAFAVVGTNLTITDSDGTLTVPLASLGTDDQNIDVLTLDASNILTVGIEDGTDLTVDLSSLVSDGSETVVTGGGINTVTGSGTTADPYIITGTEVDGSVTNEVNTAFAVVGTNLTITDSDGTLTVPLASLGTDDQNIDVLTLDASNILTVGIEDGTDLTVDLSSLVSDGSETVVTGGGINTVSGTGTGTNPYIITATEVDGSITNEVGNYTDVTITPKHKIGEYKASPTTTAVDVNETLTSISQSIATGVITYKNENAVIQTANVVSTDPTPVTNPNYVNNITVGSDGGAFYESPIKAFGKVAANGSALKIKGATVTKLNTGDYQVTFTNPMKDANYIIQLTNNHLNGVGNDDPDISYYDQTPTGFKVETGDNDNGGTDRADRDIEFMFTIFDF